MPNNRNKPLVGDSSMEHEEWIKNGYAQLNGRKVKEVTPGILQRIKNAISPPEVPEEVLRIERNRRG